MKFTPTQIADVIQIDPTVFDDDRGFFMETYQWEKFSKAGISAVFVQDNHSRSCQGVLRGLHYQIQQPQGKLVRAIVGDIYDVAVDLRSCSTTFGHWVGIHLSARNKRQLWIPPGFGHGFYVMSEWAEIVYKATEFYAPKWERTIRWDDPMLDIQWPLVNKQVPIISPKDAAGMQFLDAECYKRDTNYQFTELPNTTDSSARTPVKSLP